MHVDTLGRRKRFSPRRIKHVAGLSPSQERLHLHFSHHPLLSTEYVAAFEDVSKTEKSRYNTIQKRLSRFADTGYIVEPPQQKLHINARSHSTVWKLHDYAMRSNEFVHDMMACFITASIQLAALRAGIVYESATDILKHPKCPPATRLLEYPFNFAVNGVFLRPDRVFRLGFATTGRHFMVEASRTTKNEGTERKQLDKYFSVFERGLYQERFGTRNIQVLYVGTSQGRVDHLMEYWNKLTKGRAALRTKALFRTKPHFGTRETEWSVPSPFYDLFDDPWQTVDGPYFINRP